ncbi:MAG TPA: hypothetical protein P5026_00670 [Kiritimatiellia bacterium]|nr:hypothetical protein [Kiritimatiellia bacterium]HRU69600.1 hypothetical protein [Kiritimatiellia bacterium]
MASKSGKRILKPGASSVFVGGRPDRPAIGWRLDVREEGGKTQTFRKRHRPGAERGRLKLFHYISAGGLRQLRRTTADDIAERRQRAFLVFLGVMVLVWLVFYILPSA